MFYRDRVSSAQPKEPAMADPLERITDLVEQAERVEENLVDAIDDARMQGKTWQAISQAMGSADRQYAQGWRKLRGSAPPSPAGPSDGSMLQAVSAAFEQGNEPETVAAIDAARDAGHGWAEISTAMGSTNRQYAMKWRKRMI